MRETKQKPLIVIVGPTASGKSDAAMNVAKKHGGEIICADSRTVYKFLDIGTAKPSRQDQKKVRHHLLDVVRPSEKFSAAKFQKLANAAIKEIRSRGNLPVMAGGTGLFVDGVVFNYEFGPPANEELRAQLDKKTPEQLQEIIKVNNLEMPENIYNKVHLIRVIEQKKVNTKKQQKPRENTLLVGIYPGKEVLQKRIEKRAKQIFQSGVVEEAKSAAQKYGWENPGMSGNIYPIIKKLVEGKITQEQAKQEFATADWQLARRQMTWFRRNKFINWCESAKEAEQIINNYLVKLN